MPDVTVDEIRERLAELIARAQAGEAVTITDGGEPVARLVPPEEPVRARRPIELETLRALTRDMPPSAGGVVRRMRDGDRY
ncbi:type II toxin-antitoxin system Phd/YefM family antitoxin [Salinarimonas rosea]|uniref:type II toxin-antitoxin system Phd/YefM family antitoxin n=1 Tax=Salinarimonas rosea TaxID=552063 RepID=UPI000412B446|nr:type II toxin-antitoxin system prevent-host-death family antitoxin [Salinarimonas rosea]